MNVIRCRLATILFASLAWTSAAHAQANWKMIVVRDAATGEPRPHMRVRIRAGETVREKMTSAQGDLALSAGADVVVEAVDEGWEVRPSRVAADDARRTLDAFRWITIAGVVSAKGIDYLDEADIFATFLDPAGEDRQIASGGAHAVRLGLRPLWRAGIPDEDGRFSVRVPAVRGLAMFARLEDRFAAARRIELRDHTDLAFDLVTGLVVAGTVVDGKGDPVPDALVRMELVLCGHRDAYPESEIDIRAHGGAQIDSNPDGRFRARRSTSVRTDARGRYRFVAPTDAACVLAVRARAYAPYDGDAFWLDEATRERKLVLQPCESDARVSVRIDGKAEPGARLMVMEFLKLHRPLFEGDTAPWTYEVTLDEEGRLPPGGFSTGRRYAIHTRLMSSGSRFITWPPAERIEIDTRK